VDGELFFSTLLGSFTVNISPITTAFDGANVWVVCGNGTEGGVVNKLRASDGALIGTYSVGTDPTGIAFDGANMWVANRGDGTVTELQAGTGKLLGTFSVPLLPYGVGFDGSSIWVTSAKGVAKLRASDGVTLGVFQTPSLNTGGVAFDGANIWVTGSNKAIVSKF
jgi:DNA-binding beta-propeller fold protein YncE